MRGLSDFSLRVRLLSISALTLLVFLVLIWLGAQRWYARESALLQQNVDRLTAFVAGDVEHLLEATRQFLVAIAVTSPVGDSEQARLALATLGRHCPYYAVIGLAVHHPHGREVLATVDKEPLDETLLARAVASPALVFGEARDVDADGRLTLTLAQHVEATEPGRPPVTAFVVLEGDWLQQLLKEARITGERSLIPAPMILNVIDRAGIILARYPDDALHIGKQLPDTEVLDAILRRGEGAAELIGVSGVRRYFVFQSVKAAGGGLYVSLGVSRDATLAAARRGLVLGTAGTLCLGALLILGLWLGAGHFVTKPLARLVAATECVGRGDLGARANLVRGLREFRQLGDSFDQMSAALQSHEAERRRWQEQLVSYDRQLRAAALDTALAEEQERKQIAAGLHDDVGPLLATCYMKLGRVAKLTDGGRVGPVVEECRQVLNQTIAQLRTLTFDLSSPLLYTLGLSAAVDQVCRDMGQRYGLRIVFEDAGIGDALPINHRVVFYRAAKELLLNVVKHAEAGQVRVTCGCQEDGGTLCVEDDGVGFTPGDDGHGFSRTGGFGLFNLRERVSELGGSLEVASGPQGTRVCVRLPTRPARLQEEGET